MVHGVLGDGEHHDATGATWNFCCCHDRAGGLRLHPYAETEKAPLATASKRRRIAANIAKLSAAAPTMHATIMRK